jgi:hypothetical protein
MAGNRPVFSREALQQVTHELRLARDFNNSAKTAEGDDRTRAYAQKTEAVLRATVACPQALRFRFHQGCISVSAVSGAGCHFSPHLPVPAIVEHIARLNQAETAVVVKRLSECGIPDYIIAKVRKASRDNKI